MISCAVTVSFSHMQKAGFLTTRLIYTGLYQLLVIVCTGSIAAVSDLFQGLIFSLDAFVYWHFSFFKRAGLAQTTDQQLSIRSRCLSEIHSQTCVKLSDNIVQDLILVFKIGGCLFLHESSAESSRSAFCATLIQH